MVVHVAEVLLQPRGHALHRHVDQPVHWLGQRQHRPLELKRLPLEPVDPLGVVAPVRGEDRVLDPDETFLLVSGRHRRVQGQESLPPLALHVDGAVHDHAVSLPATCRRNTATAWSPVTTVLLVRHGLTAMTGPVLAGWTAGLALDERGRDLELATDDR